MSDAPEQPNQPADAVERPDEAAATPAERGGEGAGGQAAAASPKGPGAGRGVIYLAIAKFYFILAGAVIEFRLPSILSNTAFGAYKVVNSTVSPLNNVLITGTIRSVSRFSAKGSDVSRAVQRSGFRMHLYVGVPVAALFIALAPLTARFFHDPSKTGPLMLAGGIVLGYAFYAVYIGFANGERAFHKQAALDMTFATLRAAGILSLSIAGFGVYGAIGGWVAAAAAIVVVATFVVGPPGRRRAGEPTQPIRPLLSFFIGVALYLILLNLIMVADQLLLKRLSTDWYATHATHIAATLRAHLPAWMLAGIAHGVDPARAADGQVGLYAAVQNLARLSYQAIIAATFVVFPLVSQSTFANDSDRTRRYIHTTMRYAFMFSTAIAVVFASNPGALLGIPYQSEYALMGGPALVALALGNVAFAIFAIEGAILNGAGLTRPAIITAAVTLFVAVAANAIVIPRVPPGRELLLACGTATAGSMVLGAALGGWFLVQHFGAFMPVRTFIRVLIAAAVAIAVGHAIGFSAPLLALVEAAAVGIAFLAALVVTRELGRSDLGAVLGALRHRGQS